MKLNIRDLSIEEVNAVLIGLQELPGKICNPLTDKIRQQVIPQVEAQEKAAAAAAAETPRTINHSINEDVATADRLG